MSESIPFTTKAYNYLDANKDKVSKTKIMGYASDAMKTFWSEAKNVGNGILKYGFFNKEAVKYGLSSKGLRLSSKAFMKNSGPIGLIIGVGSLAAGVYAFASGLRTAKEGTDALKLRGNHTGSVAWSYAQTALHGSSIATLAGLGIFAPALLFACPLLAVAPSALAIGMDYFQDVCTNPNNFINEAGQFGLSNFMKDMKSRDGTVTTYLPKLMTYWEDNIRQKDEEIAKWFGFELDRPDLLLAQGGYRPGWMG